MYIYFIQIKINIKQLQYFIIKSEAKSYLINA